jgi:predicted transcriptional regulator
MPLCLCWLQNAEVVMSERPRKATRLTVSLEEQDYRMLNEIALERDASVSWVIRQAIRQFIEITPRRIGQAALSDGCAAADK